MSINEPSSFQLPEITNSLVKRKAEKGKWQCGKPSIIEAHLVLHYKGQVLDDIRKKWLIEVAKRGEK
ncbi:1666_t:CDS:2, partial [Gigaspora margarita]